MTTPKLRATFKHVARERGIERQIAWSLRTLDLSFFDEREHRCVHFCRIGGAQEMLTTLNDLDSRFRGIREQLDLILRVCHRVNWIRSTLPDMSMLYFIRDNRLELTYVKPENGTDHVCKPSMKTISVGEIDKGHPNSLSAVIISIVILNPLDQNLADCVV